MSRVGLFIAFVILNILGLNANAQDSGAGAIQPSNAAYSDAGSMTQINVTGPSADGAIGGQQQVDRNLSSTPSSGSQIHSDGYTSGSDSAYASGAQ